jgi:hypothetical protein
VTVRRLLAVATLSAPLCGAALAADDDRPRDFAAAHVLVSWKDALRSSASRTKEEAKARAEEALAELRKPGADFADVSRRFSDDVASDAEGGFLGIFERGVMVPEFERALEALGVGETSGLVETPFGWHVVRRLSLEEGLEREAARTTSARAVFFPWKGVTAPPGVRVPETARSKEEALDAARRAAAALRAGTAPDALPADLGGAPLGPGHLVTLERGRTAAPFVPFADALFAAKPGEVTDPVESPVGFVVAKRLPHFRVRARQVVVSHAQATRRPRGVERSREEARARAAEALARLRADPASWNAVLDAYGDEIGGRERGGSLGVVRPGDVQPAIEEAIRATAPGAFSEPFETPVGFHVLQHGD